MPQFGYGRVGSGRVSWTGLLVVTGALLGAGDGHAQPADREAKQLLDTARREFQQKNHAAAGTHFQNFVKRFGTHKDLAAARYGLALCLLEGAARDYSGALEQLQLLAPSRDLPEHPYVLYYLGQAQRGLGIKEQEQAAAQPQLAAKHQAAARQRFEDAGTAFAAAELAFTARAERPAADAKAIPVELEWGLRARCDQAELQLRTQRIKEAQATLASLFKDPALNRSRSYGLAWYYQGVASYLLGDLLAAGRALGHLGPLTDPTFRNHGRYLLARVHHRSDELAEAVGHYEGVLAEHESSKQKAVEALKRPESFRNDPTERARLQALLRDPPPDYVARAAFYLGVLLYEGGRFSDAAARLALFVKLASQSPLALDAQLRLGFCQVQLKQFAEAGKTLQAVADREPGLRDQALFWLGKAQAGAADPAKPALYTQGLKTAVETLRRAAARAQELTASDPRAKSRLGEIRLEIGDTQQLAQQFKDAAATYGQILSEGSLPVRTAEVLQRQAAALNLAGEYAESDKVCERFQQSYPDSPLLAAVLFRRAENAHFRAQVASKDLQLPNRAQELARLNQEAGKRYQLVLDRFPEFELVPLARYELALTLYRQGEFEKAKEALERIPASDRSGPLAPVSYLMADCLIRLAPIKADDALAAGRVQENLQAAIEQLDAFATAQPGAPETPDALLKLGHCQQRLAALFADPKEVVKVLTAARATYERFQKQFPRHPLHAQAVFERGKVMTRLRDPNRAIAELQPFVGGALRQSEVAPLALLYVATTLRGQNKAEQAAGVLAQGRQQHEAALLGDKARAQWVPLLQYHHGVCLQEAGKLPEARALFEQVIQQFPLRPEAHEATLRAAQCVKATALQKIDKARQKPTNRPDDLAALTQALEETLLELRTAVDRLATRADGLKQKQPDSEVRARLLVEAARICRLAVTVEAFAAGAQLKLAGNKGEPAERRARALYEAVIEVFPDLPLATDARLELSELLVERGEHEAALKMLNEALDREPPPDLTDKVRVLMGTCHMAKGDTKAALAQFDAVLRNPKSQQAAQAHYRAGECLARAGQWAAAAQRLAGFRNQPPFQNLPGLTDRALLRLGQVHGELKQWDQARQAYEMLLGRFGNSPLAAEARYGMGGAWQHLKQYDQAVNAYAPLTASAAGELAAKAQLQIGLCRLEQKRYADAVAALRIVPDKYTYPQLSAIARLEAARAHTELKQRDPAEKLLQQVVQDQGSGEWADVAQAQLKALRRRALAAARGASERKSNGAGWESDGTAAEPESSGGGASESRRSDRGGVAGGSPEHGGPAANQPGAVPAPDLARSIRASPSAVEAE